MAFDLSQRPTVKVGIEMSDFCLMSEKLNLPVARIRAVDDVESAGSGFLTKGATRPKILFEGHYFYGFLKKRGLAEQGRAIDPTVCYPTWTKVHYIGRNGEYGRLAKATEICAQLGVSDALALMSASWGRYQVMGANFSMCGFTSVEEFCEAMFLDEDNHLEAFADYIVSAGIDDELRDGNYTRFVERYNGPGYRKNLYRIKLPAAVRKFDAMNIDCSSIVGQVVEAMPGLRDPDPAEIGLANTGEDNRYLRVLSVGMNGEDVKAAQERLIEYAFLAPDGADGSYGRKTRDAVIGFQRANGLTDDGILGPSTWNKLFA